MKKLVLHFAESITYHKNCAFIHGSLRVYKINKYLYFIVVNFNIKIMYVFFWHDVITYKRLLIFYNYCVSVLSTVALSIRIYRTAKQLQIETIERAIVLCGFHASLDNVTKEDVFNLWYELIWIYLIVTAIRRWRDRN